MILVKLSIMLNLQMIICICAEPCWGLNKHLLCARTFGGWLHLKKYGNRTRRTDISTWVMEVIIQNYEDGDMTDDEFVSILKLFGKEPDDFGFNLNVDAAA